MARPKLFYDRYWIEVLNINNYAIFMGYLLMSVRGLGLLVLTWSTVVLLGGFVSMLRNDDFWSLTVITLVQSAGVFDFLLKEKARDIVSSLKGMLGALFVAVEPFEKDKGKSASSKAKEDEDPSIAALVVAFVAWLVQLLVLAIVLCPVAVLYVLGLYISSVISLWRLIVMGNDYGNAEGGANLKPALKVLYSLAVLQGVVFGYKTIYEFVAKDGLVAKVASYYSLDEDIIKEYLDETVTGCMKDPSFARGRNLITYAVDLVESKLRYTYISGVVILGTMLLDQEDPWRLLKRGPIEQLVTGSASFSHVVQRLLETFGPTSPYSTEIREHAARIVANVAGSIRLEEQFPGGTVIQCVYSSLLDTFEEYSWRPEGYVRDSRLPREYERDWLLEQKGIIRPWAADRKTRESDSGNNNPLQGYKGLVVQGLRILQGLAINEDNYRVMSNDTGGLLSKIMAPLISDQLPHGDRHDEWSSIAQESMEVMSRLMAAPGDTGSKLRSEISGNGQATIIANDILECSKCDVFLKRQAVKVLLDLSGDTPTSVKSGGSNNTIFMGLLLHIFLLPDYHRRMRGSTHLAKKNSYITKLAGEKLKCAGHLSSQHGASATSMPLPSSVAAVVADLTRTSVDAANNVTDRLHAVRILGSLCRWYTKDDEYLKELKKAMADVMPKVVEEILVGHHHGSTSGVHAVTEASNVQVSAPGTDLEKGGDVQGNNASSSQQQNGEEHEGTELRDALMSLCRDILGVDR